MSKLLFSLLCIVYLNGCSMNMPSAEKYSINDTVYIGEALRSKAIDVDPVDDKTRILARKLIEAANEGNNAVGLAAPQIGINKSIFVYRIPEVKDGTVIFPQSWNIAVNATYTPIGDEVISMPEGCFSVPHFYSMSVPRYKKIRFSYLTLDGVRVEGIAQGLKGQIIQHETDHLNGVLYIDKIINIGELRKRNELDLDKKVNE